MVKKGWVRKMLRWSGIGIQGSVSEMKVFPRHDVLTKVCGEEMGIIGTFNR